MRLCVSILLSCIVCQSAAQAAPHSIGEPDTGLPAVPPNITPQEEPMAVPAPDSEPNIEPSVVQKTKDALSNSIYLILRQSPDRKSLGESTRNEQLPIHDERALEGDEKDDITYFMIQKPDQLFLDEC